MYEFNELEWAQKQYRGKVKFGDHARVAVTLPVTEGTIHFPTGSLSEVFVKLGIRTSPFGGPRMLIAVTNNPVPAWDDPDARNLGPWYMTADGIDPMSKEHPGQTFLKRKPRPANAALTPSTDYYYHWKQISKGHASMAKRGTTIDYSGTNDEDHGGEVVISAPVDVEGYRVDLGILGGPGTFIPDV
jgi:hypothetical protein